MIVEDKEVACSGKARHANRDAANIEVKRTNNKSKFLGKKLKVYKCDFCGGFHIGNVKI